MTALIRRWAARCGFVDRPGGRKTHSHPVALGGGIVIFWLTMGPVALAVISALWLHHWGAPRWLNPALSVHIAGLAARGPAVAVLVGSAGILHLLGLIDDRHSLGPGVKLMVQLAVATVVATLGEIRFTFFVQSYLVTTVLSVLWIVVIINAFNFLDNMDGLSAGIAVICAAMIFAAAMAGGQVFVGGLLAIMIGVLLGFLVFNFAPAKIFMGDAGALVVGLLIAVATIRTTYYYEQTPGGAWYATLMPVVVLAVPLYDFISVTVLRLGRGASPFVGDQQHFSHRLLRRGMTSRQAVLTIYLATMCTGLGATVLHQVSQVGAVLIFVQTVLIVLIIAILERPAKANQ